LTATDGWTESESGSDPAGEDQMQRPTDRAPLEESLTAERWARVKELFEAALERGETERSAFLADACRDDESLRHHVESLLAGHLNAGSFLETGPAQQSANSSSSEEKPPTLAVGELVRERYEILRFIGRGGMGEVYEARDLELRTRVALKTIRPELSAHEGTRARFKDEIRLARRINDRSVCRTFHLDYYRPRAAEPEITFIIMELLEGESLAQHLRKHGRMLPDKALPLLRQMAEGLAAAHAAQVVHCDFKPGNVMLVPEAPSGVDSQQSTGPINASTPPAAERGLRVVITDFGLARAIAPSGQESRTGPASSGQLVGTPAYMAPEQLQGLKATPAADVYALGLVMYETLTGRQPFEDDPYRRLREEPVAPGTQAPGLDRRWETLILRCLQKDPAARYASAKQAAEAIQALGAADQPKGLTPGPHPRRRRALAGALAAAAALALAAMLVKQIDPLAWQKLVGPRLPDKKILAVLPCEAVDARADEQARCRGLTEVLTAKLAQFGSVDVPAAAVLRERGVNSIARARSQLGATLVLEASWEEEGPSAQIVLSLVNAKTEKLLRTDAVKADADDVFGLQTQVSLAATEMLALTPSAANQEELMRHGTATPSAYDFYVQGLGYLQDYEKPSDLDLAIGQLQRAVAADSQYAEAQATLSLAYWYKYTATRDGQWAAKAKAAVEAAEKLNSRLPEVQMAIGDYSQRTGDYQAAAAAFQRAIDLNPRSEDAYEGLGRAYDSLNRFDDAEHAFRTAVNIRPACSDCYNNLGGFYYRHGRFDEALQAWQRLIALAPDNSWGYMNIGNVFLARMNFQKADEYYREALGLSPDDPDVYSNLGTTSYFLGQYAEAAEFCQKAVSLVPKKHEYWGNLGDAYRMIPGDEAKARQAYRQAILVGEEDLRINPRSAGLLGNLAQYYVHVGEAGKAQEYLDRALKLAPNAPAVLFAAGIVHLSSGERPEALKWFARAVSAGYPRGWLAADGQFDALRSDPGFSNLVKEEQPRP
jgi:eukaryotic-like serine/threonine-protein kinase